MAPGPDLYDRHPINAEQILEAAAAAGHDPGALKPSDLRPHDMDHYGGEAVVHELARAACIRPGHRIADVCAGMAGPARLVAEHYGAEVVGLDYNWSRCQGAVRLNEHVGMADRVRIVRCDAQKLPLADASVDAAISQEALLHIPGKEAVLDGVFRALRHGGRFAFTDLVALPPLSTSDRVRLAEDGMQMVDIRSTAQYRAIAGAAGFEVEAVTDLSDNWKVILAERLEMYRNLRVATERVHGAAAHRQYIGPYEFFVGLVQQGALGGIRMVLRKSGF